MALVLFRTFGARLSDLALTLLFRPYRFSPKTLADGTGSHHLQERIRDFVFLLILKTWTMFRAVFAICRKTKLRPLLRLSMFYAPSYLL